MSTNVIAEGVNIVEWLTERVTPIGVPACLCLLSFLPLTWVYGGSRMRLALGGAITSAGPAIQSATPAACRVILTCSEWRWC